ncbi:protein mini spindles isoform X1 [Microplitis demolitor]|uniref:protein mini spindles isoform X1 n=1 Tax=Microplitis demolitor TaxID=69319 RepID=UPI0004CD3427|nr:protein mini spindles isoform X1 [Microplitis demolitor]
MEEETEFTKLPVEDRCVHKSWKARVHGYDECTKKFGCIDDEKSPEWNKFLGLIKKFVVDSNVAAQEKGLEAALTFIENAACAGKTVGEVMSGIVNKCIAAPKAKTKDLAVQITLMYIEIEKHETVQEELLKGTEAKNPKIVAGCINTLTLSLREYGSKVINIKPLIKKMPGFLEDRDKIVREEGKLMVIEIYRWIGAPIKQQLNTLKPVQMSELEVEFAKLDGAKPHPTRYLRSQKPKNVVAESAAAEGDDADDDEENEEEAADDIDPYELIDPVDILSKLPKDFFDKVEAKKWQERKEALETLETLSKNPKLESGDYGDVIRVLKKVIAKDANVVVVTVAGKCMTGLANGLKKRFHPYATACLPVLLEKFREKKPNVVAVLREAADAVFQSITVDVILEDVLAALDNKNPSVKAETAGFLSRCFANTLPATLNKKLLKAYIGALLKTLNEPDPTVRDNSAEALGTAMKLVGEKAMMPFLTDLDPLKMAKIQECAEKAVILVKVVAPRKADRPTTALAKVESKPPAKSNKKPAASSTSNNKKPGVKKPAAAAAKKTTAPPKIQIEKDLSAESVDDIAGECLSGDILSGLVDANWKSRLAAVEQLNDTIKQMGGDVPCQVIVRILAKKPGLKDTNFQVLKQRLEIVKMLAENYTFSVTAASYCIMDIAEKLGDSKNGSIAAETLLAIAEATSFEHVATEVITFAFNQKSPKVQQESLLWLSNALLEFGCTLNVKGLIDSVKKAVAATNPGVRTAAITLIGTLYLYVGKPLLMFFENEKSALKQQIEQECDKHEGERPPEPVRGPKSRESKKVSDDMDEDDEDNDVGGETVEINDLIPRVDISNQITEALLAELGDKNWKVRNEGLVKVQTIIAEARFIKGSIGELPRALSPRLIDSNTKISQTALGICESLATAMGPPIKQHVRTLFPGFVHCLGDSKNWIRSAAISCINTWGDQCGYKEFFDGEMIADALKAGSPTLRIELWNWLSQKLPPIPVKQVPKEELMLCLPHLYSNLEDRNSDVRKNAQEAILGFMMHLTYEGMVRQTEKLKPGSKNVVMVALEKTRPSLPMKPLPTKKPAQEQVKTVKSGGAAKASKAVVKPKSASAKPASARKKDDDVDTSPLLAVNNLKHQRVIDEQKLKVLKWNFTTPREEFVELLKELMSTAGVNKSLIANMFHTDFRYHLKAIESLSENVQDNSKALVSNLDLILKWLTLRFFDTNPSVLLKGLDFLQSVFNILIEGQYHMLENEAASFLPYLILKIGDPKDSVRNSVRALFKRIALVYPVSKLFSYVMEGLKSKNARQRTECLDQLGSLIENYGVTVCQPTPAAALREIAKQIADRDNSVRNAALNCIVQAYYLEGDRINKLIGHISEKDQSLLEERIKRANKNRPSKPASEVRMSTMPMAAATSNEDIEPDVNEEKDEEPEEVAEDFNDRTLIIPTTINKRHDKVPINDNNKISKSSDKFYDDQENNSHNNVVNNKTEKTYALSPPQSPVRPKTSGPFGLDMEFLRQLEEQYPASWSVPVLTEINWDSNDSITSPQNIDRLAKKYSPSLSSKLGIIKPSVRVSPVTSPVSAKNDNLDCTILLMASPRLNTALEAMNTMEEIMKSSQLSLIQSKEDKFINSINIQLKFLQKYPLTADNNEVTKVYRATFMVLLAFYESKVLGRNVTTGHLKEIIYLMLMLLAENKFENVKDTDMYMRVVNVIIVKMIDYSNHTTLICVLIKLLQECAESSVMPKYEELVMKCLWKIVKTISNWSTELDYDTILLTVHQFFKDYPSSWWKTRHSDMPVRTVKTVLHSMTKIKGSSILNHLTMINNIHESELRSYLNRLIEMINSNSNNINSGSSTITKQKHLSKEMHTQLTEIFRKIGSKQHTQEGLAQLYDFKQQHPEADIQPFLVKSHQFFQNFIEQGLKSIDLERKNQIIYSHGDDPADETARAISSAEERISMDPAQRLERLRALEAQYRGNGSRPT